MKFGQSLTNKFVLAGLDLLEQQLEKAAETMEALNLTDLAREQRQLVPALREHAATQMRRQSDPYIQEHTTKLPAPALCAGCGDETGNMGEWTGADGSAVCMDCINVMAGMNSDNAAFFAPALPVVFNLNDRVIINYGELVNVPGTVYGLNFGSKHPYNVLPDAWSGTPGIACIASELKLFVPGEDDTLEMP